MGAFGRVRRSVAETLTRNFSLESAGTLPRVGRPRTMAHLAPLACHLPPERISTVDTQTQVLRILDEVLSLGGRALKFDAATPLLGAIPELDSMAVVTLITTLEERFGIAIDDDEISGDTFATVSSLNALVTAKLAG